MYHTREANLTTSTSQMLEILHKVEVEQLPHYQKFPSFAGFTIARFNDVFVSTWSLEIRRHHYPLREPGADR